METNYPLPDSPPRGNVYPPQPSPEVPEDTMASLVVTSGTLGAEDHANSPTNTEASTGEQIARTVVIRSSTGDATLRQTTINRQRRPPQLTIQTGAPTRESPPVDSRSSSVTLTRNDEADQPQVEETPVMRSMFPTMGSNVTQPPANPLNRTTPSPLPPPPPRPSHFARSASPMIYPPQAAPVHEMVLPYSGSPAMSTSRLFGELPLVLSDSDELLDLWTIANGQLSQEAKQFYRLDLQCALDVDGEVMRFASSTSSPFYSLRAKQERVELTRSHPLNSAQEVIISNPTLQKPTSNSPVLASISPLLAELLAQDSASNLAVTNGLSRQNHDSLQAQAINQARALESASLLWDSDTASYFFTIPGIKNPQPNLSQTLPIFIRPGLSISLLDSARNSLLVLNLDEATLTIHTRNIKSLSSSPYSLDLLISVLMTLLLHLHRHTSLLAPNSQTTVVPHFDPPPTIASNPASPRGGSRASKRPKAARNSRVKPHRWLSTQSSRSRSGDAYVQSPAPVALRSPTVSAFSSPYLSSPDPKDMEAAISLAELKPTLSTPIPTIPTKGVAPELRKDVTGVDLSRFQAYDLSDPEIGAVTRGMLRVLYWGFGVLVWILGVVVGVMAAGIVAVGGCIGNGNAGGKRKIEGRIDGGREG